MMIIVEQSFQYVLLLNATAQDANSILSLHVTVGGEIWWETVGDVFGKRMARIRRTKHSPAPEHGDQPFCLTHSPPRENLKEE